VDTVDSNGHRRGQEQSHRPDGGDGYSL